METRYEQVSSDRNKVFFLVLIFRLHELIKDYSSHIELGKSGKLLLVRITLLRSNFSFHVVVGDRRGAKGFIDGIYSKSRIKASERKLDKRYNQRPHGKKLRKTSKR